MATWLPEIVSLKNLIRHYFSAMLCCYEKSLFPVCFSKNDKMVHFNWNQLNKFNFTFFKGGLVFPDVIDIERTWVFNSAGNFFTILSELALFLCPKVFRVMTGPKFILFPFPILLSVIFKFIICLSNLWTRRPLSNVSMTSNCENISLIIIRNLEY